MAKHTIDKLAIQITADSANLAADLARAGRSLQAFAKSVNAMKPPEMPRIDMTAVKSFAAGFSHISKAAKDATASVAAIAAKTAVATATFATMRAGAMAVGAGFEQVKQSVNLAADLEQTTLAFEVMLGSAEQAKKMVGDIRQFAATTPFNTRELTDAARQLTAYGIAADQALPTLRMLGDITAGLGGKSTIGEMAYLYGTLNAQGRAFAKDIYQFTNRGVELLPPLAKQFGVTTGEVSKLVEEGRVGFPEVSKAMQTITAEGGRFYEMTKRQSKTFAGLRETAFDSLDMLKTKLGQIVIDEFGLKEAAKDFDAWAKDVTAKMDQIRPAVKFTGDALKGLVQVSYEVAKAGAQVAAINFEQAGGAFPGMKAAAENFRKTIEAAQNFKFDRVAVAKFAVAAGEVVITAIETAVRATAEFGKGLKANVVDPIIDAAKAITSAVNTVKAMKGVAADAAGDPAKMVALQAAAMQMMFGGNAAKPPGDLLAGADLAAVREIEAMKNKYRGAATREVFRNAGDDPAGAVRDQVQMFNARRRFEGDDAAIHQALMGWGDAFQLKLKDAVAAAAPPPAPPSFWEFDKKGLLAAGNALVARVEREEELKAAQKFAADAKSAADGMSALKAALRESGMAGALHNAAMAAGRFEGVLSDLSPGFRQFWERGFYAAAKAEKIRDFTGPTPTLTEFANGVKNELDPTRALKIEKMDLDKAMGFGLITPDMRDAAWTRKVRGLASQLGVGGDAQLADAVMVGSQEDARLLARHSTGSGPQRTEEILQRIEKLLEQSIRQDADANRRMPKIGILGM